MAPKLYGWDDGKIYYWDDEKHEEKEICVSEDPILFGKLVEVAKNYYRQNRNVSTKRKLTDFYRQTMVKRAEKCSCGNDIFLRIYDPFGLDLMCWNCDRKIGNYLETGLQITDAEWAQIKERF